MLFAIAVIHIYIHLIRARIVRACIVGILLWRACKWHNTPFATC